MYTPECHNLGYNPKLTTLAPLFLISFATNVPQNVTVRGTKPKKSTLTRDIDTAILSVRPSVGLSVCLSVRLSVTRWYCMKTA